MANDDGETGANGAKDVEPERGTWEKQLEFFVTCLGSTVGYINIWRFPFLCYANGGAAFLIPYLTMLLGVGLPLFFMELALGQYLSLGPARLFAEIAPLFTGLGWSMVVLSAFTAIYFNVIIAWVIFYAFASFTTVLPWGHCDNDFNSAGCFTAEAEEGCQNISKYHYNNTCMTIEEICKSANLENSCVDPTNFRFNIKTAGSIINRFSAGEDYFKNRMLGVTGTTWWDMGAMRWEIAGCLALAWIMVGLRLGRGITRSGKEAYTALFYPCVALVILLIRGLTLPGAYKGIEFYFLRTEFRRLLSLRVWYDAATYLFFSLGPSFGGLITLASYNKFKNNCMRDAIVITFTSCASSVFASFVVFSILGFLATDLGVEMDTVMSAGSDLAFTILPTAMSRIPLAPLWAILFFCAMIPLGLNSQVVIVETLATTVFDRFRSLRTKKPLVVGLLCLVLFLCGLTMCLEGGVHMITLIDTYTTVSFIIFAYIEIIVVQYFFGFSKFIRCITHEMGIPTPWPLVLYWGSTWLIITPLFFKAFLFMFFKTFVPVSWGDYVYPGSIQALGWLMFLSSVILIPLGAIYVLCKGDYRGKELIKSTTDFCPHHVRKIRRSRASVTNGRPMGGSRYTYNTEGFWEASVTNAYNNEGFQEPAAISTFDNRGILGNTYNNEGVQEANAQNSYNNGFQRALARNADNDEGFQEPAAQVPSVHPYVPAQDVNPPPYSSVSSSHPYVSAKDVSPPSYFSLFEKR